MKNNESKMRTCQLFAKTCSVNAEKEENTPLIVIHDDVHDALEMLLNAEH